MRSRLDRVSNWQVLAVQSCYSPRGLARLCSVSLRQLERYFHASRGTRVKDWLTDERMRQGLLLLGQADTVKAAAFALGYKQVSHFSREFKRFFNMSPSSFFYASTPPVANR